jgi:ABC-type uncharacterized transport system substrate-binding protein
VGSLRGCAAAGYLLSYRANRTDLVRRATVFVDKILKGAQPGELPPGQPTKFELVINLRTAKALDLTIPPSLLQRADQVIDSWTAAAGAESTLPKFLGEVWANERG